MRRLYVGANVFPMRRVCCHWRKGSSQRCCPIEDTFDWPREPLGDELKHLSANLDYATIPNSQAARGAKRKIEDAVANIRSTVGDANYHGSLRASYAGTPPLCQARRIGSGSWTS